MKKKSTHQGPGLKKTAVPPEGGLNKLFRLSTALSAAAKKVVSPQGWQEFAESLNELRLAQAEFEKEIPS